MQNKRGISQALSPTATTARTANPVIRRACVFDVFHISRILCASIRDLCSADHQNDPEKMRLWLQNKTPEDVRGWIADEALLWVIEDQAAPSGVGLITASGEISLLYLAPDAAGTGQGRALLQHLEAELQSMGHAEAYLTATKTGLGFYLSQGWQQDGAAGPCHDVTGYPMRKLLQASL